MDGFGCQLDSPTPYTNYCGDCEYFRPVKRGQCTKMKSKKKASYPCETARPIYGKYNCCMFRQKTD